MLSARYLLFASALMLTVPAARLNAQVIGGPYTTYETSAYDEGFRRGELVGQEDARRGAAFNFRVALEFRRGDIGWTARFGDRNRYREDFRVGFEAGYRQAYDRFRGDSSYYNNGFTYSTTRDMAFETGFNDGYEEGLSDGRSRRRNSPTEESRYRNADRGYENWYGARAVYQTNYRRAFYDGYERGYRDGWSGYR